VNQIVRSMLSRRASTVPPAKVAKRRGQAVDTSRWTSGPSTAWCVSNRPTKNVTAVCGPVQGTGLASLVGASASS